MQVSTDEISISMSDVETEKPIVETQDFLNNFFNNDSANSIMVTVNNPYFQFFHFGCWNIDGCQEDSNLLNVVNVISKEEYMFGIIAGDNVYKKAYFLDNGIKKKMYKKEVLDDGITCLERLNVPLFTCLGNHDVETCDILIDEVRRTKGYFQNNRLIAIEPNARWILPHNYYDLIINVGDKKLHFIFIDTNLFSIDKDCYDDKNDKLNVMLKWLDNRLKVNATITLIVGHVYLFGFKVKNNNEQIVQLHNVERLLDVMMKNNKPMFYYLCADLHNFQHIIFTGAGKYDGMLIDNITSGTGGGSPDPIPVSDDGTITKVCNADGELLGSILLDKKHEPYGFVKHIFEDGKITSSYEYITY